MFYVTWGACCSIEVLVFQYCKWVAVPLRSAWIELNKGFIQTWNQGVTENSLEGIFLLWSLKLWGSCFSVNLLIRFLLGNLPFSVSGTWTLQQNLTNQVLRHTIFFSLFFSLSAIFCYLITAGWSGRGGEGIANTTLEMKIFYVIYSLCIVVLPPPSPPPLFLGIRFVFFQTDFFFFLVDYY